MTFQLRESIKTFGLNALSTLGAMRLGEYISRRKLLALTYHRVISRSDWPHAGHPPNALFDDEFDAQMAFVARRFNALGGQQLRSVIEGARPPNYSVVITFDDGYENNFTHALPILQRHGLHAVFFVTSNLVGSDEGAFWFDRLDHVLKAATWIQVREAIKELDGELGNCQTAREMRGEFKRLSHARQSQVLERLESKFHVLNCVDDNPALYRSMTWYQVRALAQAGMTIGSHTVNHQILSAVDPDAALAELVESRRKIEAEVGEACWCFGYPNGQRQDFRESDEKAVAQAGYLCAFTQIPGGIERETPRYALPRIPIPDVGDLTVFRSYVSGLNRSLAAVLGR